MTMQFLQILGLLVVVIGFTTLVLWTYSPLNKDRFEAGSKLALDQDERQQDAPQEADLKRAEK